MKTVAAKSKRRSNLTIAMIETVKIPEGETETKLWDGKVSGLCLRCFAGGGRSWTYRYRPNGGGRSAKVRSIKLGNYPALSIEAARKAAEIQVGAVAKDIDPAQVRAEKRRYEAATLGKLLAENGPYEKSLKARRIVKVDQALSSLRRGLARLMNSISPSSLALNWSRQWTRSISFRARGRNYASARGRCSNGL